MKSILVLVALVCINLFINQATCYVLLAANVDDFRTLAQKVIPPQLALQLTDILTRHSQRNRPVTEESSETYEDNASEHKTIRSNERIRYEKVDNKAKSGFSRILPNMDAILQQVKKKLAQHVKVKNEPKRKEEDIEEKPEKYTNVQVPIQADDKNLSDDEIHEPSAQSSNFNLQEKLYNEADNVEATVSYGQQSINPNDQMQYERKDIKKTKGKDSYEDYVTPKKGNVFASDEGQDVTTPVKPNKLVHVNRKETTPKPGGFNLNPQRIQKQITTELIKARTAELKFDENKKNVRIRLSNTGKPTSFPHYKISSPNYYKKLPVVAEKYNFDEPIPERDREREKLKSIPNPPARINGKLKYQA